MSAEHPNPRFLWVGPVRDPSGHADELRGFLRAQERAGDAPALHEMSWIDKEVGLSAADASMLERQLARREEGAFDVAVHTYLPRRDGLVVIGALNVSRVMFETDRLPDRWRAPLLERDEIWVPCRHNFEAFADSGVPARKMRVVGGTLDFDLFSPTAEPYPLDVDEERFTFLTNFDFSARKGWEILLQAWGQAFTAEDPVCLVLKTGTFYREPGFVEGRIESFLREEFGAGITRLAPIQMLTDMLETRDMPRLYAAADAYVLASRGEGWGRPYMEAQAMGLPTIASRWGGQLEFMDEDTSWLVDGELVPVPDDAELFNSLYKGHRWFEPDVDDLAAKLRDIAADWDTACERAAPARQRLIDRFGAEATASTLRDAARGAIARMGDPTQPRCVIRGEFGSTASLATVNDGVAGGLEDLGYAVHHRVPGSAPVSAAVPGVSHCWPHDFSPVTDGPTIVVVGWEYGAPPSDWVRAARERADRVWVYSDYVRRHFVAGGMPPGIVEVVPGGFDPERFSPDGPVYPLPDPPACTFLFVGGTIWRKGIDRLLAAWVEAFEPGDDVALVIKDFGTNTWYRGQTAHGSLREFAARKDIARVIYIGDDLAARDLPPLYRAADVVVTPYRGEGFCLPALEALACGVPVIHTGSGPTAEFVSDDAGWAIPAREEPVPPGFDYPELNGPAVVQEIDHAGLVAALREAAFDPEQRRRRAHAAPSVAARHTWLASAQAARASLHALDREALPLARDARPDAVPFVPGTKLIVYAPDWTAHERWSSTLALWARSFAEGDPVTLALHCGDQDPDELAGSVMERLTATGLDEQALPDLMLCRPDISLADLVAAADAVLVDDADRERPELVRRALRVLAASPADMQALRAELAAGSDGRERRDSSVPRAA